MLTPWIQYYLQHKLVNSTGIQQTEKYETGITGSWKIWGFHSSVVEDPSLLDCDAMSTVPGLSDPADTATMILQNTESYLPSDTV